MYYLNSRYYNPEWGRFINADGIVGQTGELLSHNMFMYCKNNPVNMLDDSGYWPKWVSTALKITVAVAVVAVIAVSIIATAGITAVTAPALISGAVGGILGFGGDVLSQRANGKGWSEIDYGQSALAAAGGFASGIFGCAANGGVAAQMAVNAALGFEVAGVNALCEGRQPTKKELFVGVVSGMAGGLAGGPGGGKGGVLGPTLARSAVVGGVKAFLGSTGVNVTASILGRPVFSPIGSSYGLNVRDI